MSARTAPGATARVAANAASKTARPMQPARSRNPSTGLAPSPVRTAVAQALRSTGRPLEAGLRGFLETGIGRVDTSAVDTPRAPLALPIARADDALERDADRAAQRIAALAGAPSSNTLPSDASPARGAASPWAAERSAHVPFRPDLSRVRIHTGPAASAASHVLRAHAFSVGDDVFFGEGGYLPGQLPGLRLLAHEIAHVAQRLGGRLLRKGMADQAMPVSPADADLDDKDDSAEAVALQSPMAGDAAPAAAPAAPIGAAPDAAAAPAAATAAPSHNAALAAPPGVEGAGDSGKAPQSPGELPTGDLGLIDEELAEHERWGAAARQVGAAGSAERAAFIADQAGEGSAKGFKEGVVQGAKTAVAMKLAEKAIAKGAVAIATRLGAQAAKFTPLPGIGAVIGGVMAGIDLAKRDWGATGKQIAGFGKGADVYEQLANSLEAISTVIEVATQVANVIAGILGAITVIMWIAAVATAGVISPMAATLTSISLAIGIGTMVLDGINALVLKELITMFRALHAFASDADPRDVVAQGQAIEGAAGAATGFVGGLVGAKAAEKGMHLATPKPAPKVPGHANPPASGGEGPSVKAEPPVAETAGGTAKNTAGTKAGAPAAELPAPAHADAPNASPARAESPAAHADKPVGPMPAEPRTDAPAAKAAPAAPVAIPEPAKAGAAPEPAAGAAKPIEIEAVPQKAPAHEAAVPGAPATKSQTPEPSAPKAGPTEPVAEPAKPKAGPIDERSFKDLNPLVDEVSQGHFGDKLDARDTRTQNRKPQAARQLTGKQARNEANADAKAARLALGMTDPNVQAGHTFAARHTKLTGAPHALVGDPRSFQQLHSRLARGPGKKRIEVAIGPNHGPVPDAGLNVGVRDPSGITKTTTRHRVQEGFLDTAFDRGVQKNPTRLIEAQTAASQEARWRSQGTGLAQPEVNAKRASGLFDEAAAIEKSPAVKARREALAKAASADAPAATTKPQPGAPAGFQSPAASPVGTVEPASPTAPAVADPAASGGRDAGAGHCGGGGGGGGGGEGGGGGPSASSGEPSGPLFPGLTDAEFDASFKPVAGPMVQMHPVDARLRLPAAQGGELWGVDPASGMTVQEWNVNAERGMPRLDPAGQPIAGPRGNVRTQVRLHSPDPSAVAGSPSREGWTMGIEQRNARRLPDGTWFDTRRGTLPNGQALDVTPYRRGADGQWTREGTPGPVTDAPTLAALADWDRKMAASHMPLFPAPRTGGPSGTPPPNGPGPDGQPSTPAAAAQAAGTTSASPTAATPVAVPQAASLDVIAPHVDPGAPTGGAPANLTPLAPKAPAVNAASPAADPAVPGATGDAVPASAAAGAAPSAASAAPGPAAPTAATPATKLPTAPAAAAPPKSGGDKATGSPPAGGVAAPGGETPVATPPSATASPKERTLLPPAAPITSSAPVIEHVNPAYQPPPGTPDDLASLRNQIIDTLQARAVAEQHAHAMGQQKQHHEANEKPLADMKGGTAEAMTATEAHQKAIANRDEANERKKAEESKAHSKVDDYASRAGRLTSLTVPLKGLARFTGLARSLPNEPDFVLRFRSGVLKMNTDATRFLGQLDQMDAAMADQKTLQVERQKGVEADGATLKQTDAKANASVQALQDAKQTNDDFDQKNKERKVDAAQQQKGAQQTAASLGAQAKSRERQAVSLAAAMQFWAQGHAKARADAVAATTKRLVDMGYRVTEVREK